MLGQIVGIKNIDYVSKRTNQRVIGRKVFLLYPISEKDGIGFSTDEVYLNSDIKDSLNIDDKIDFIYNKFGSIIGIKTIE